jgi:hypothetical protein
MRAAITYKRSYPSEPGKRRSVYEHRSVHEHLAQRACKIAMLRRLRTVKKKQEVRGRLSYPASSNEE